MGKDYGMAGVPLLVLLRNFCCCRPVHDVKGCGNLKMLLIEGLLWGGMRKII